MDLFVDTCQAAVSDTGIPGIDNSEQIGLVVNENLVLLWSIYLNIIGFVVFFDI